MTQLENIISLLLNVVSIFRPPLIRPPHFWININYSIKVLPITKHTHRANLEGLPSFSAFMMVFRIMFAAMKCECILTGAHSLLNYNFMKAHTVFYFSCRLFFGHSSAASGGAIRGLCIFNWNFATVFSFIEKLLIYPLEIRLIRGEKEE